MAADAAGWKPLFNGKNLNGWSPHYASKTPADAPPPASIFRVEDGAIHVYPTQPAGSEQPNAYLVTDADHQDYVLSLEYRWGEKKFAPRLNLVRDAGLLYHVHRERARRLAGRRRGADPGRRRRRLLGRVRAASPASWTRRPAATRCRKTAACRCTVGNEGKFERTRHNRVNEYPGLEHAGGHRAR